MAPPRAEKAVGRAPTMLQMDLSRLNVEAIVIGPPTLYTRPGKAPTRITTENGPEQNTRAARAVIEYRIV